MAFVKGQRVITNLFSLSAFRSEVG